VVEPQQHPASQPEAAPGPAPCRQRFRPHERIRDARDFRRAYSSRRSVSDAFLVLHAVPNGCPHSRLGISVPRKLVRRAARRNRLKRRIREAFRTSKAALPVGLDLVVVPRVAELTFRQASTSLPRLAQDAARRLGLESTKLPPGP
jgi:ribonuclease P protein component